jgi:acyl carrier protein
VGLELVEIVMDLEDHFAISLPDDVVSRCNTVADLQQAILRVLVAGGTVPSAELDDRVFEGLVRVIAKRMRLDPAQICPDSTLVGDITADG